MGVALSFVSRGLVDLLVDVPGTTSSNQSLLSLGGLSIVLRSGNLFFGRSLLVGFDCSFDLGVLLQWLAGRRSDLGIIVLTLIFADSAIVFSFSSSSSFSLATFSKNCAMKGE